MASTVKSVATPDSTQRISTKTRNGVSAVLGGAVALGATAAAVHFGVAGGIPAAVSKVRDLVVAYHAIPDLKTVPYLSNIAGFGTVTALGGAAFLTGAGIGGAAGKLSAHQASLNDVKSKLALEGSDLNFSQIHRIADVAVQGGIFKGRSTSVQFKEDSVRIHNLNNTLTSTEHSLSSNAHKTSKARGTEDRFFDAEGARLASVSGSTASFVQTLNSLKSAVHSEVKATDKYTYQQGNSSTAVNRREYILAGIMGFAYSRGIAGSYLSAAVEERMAKAKTNPKQADAEFKQAIQKGIAAGILSPSNDTKSYEGMVQAAAVASLASAGKNPDSIISSIFDAFKEAGLIDPNLRARFMRDVHAKITNPKVVIASPEQVVDTKGQAPGFFQQIFKARASSADPKPAALNANAADMDAEVAGTEEGLSDPTVESKAQVKARLAAAAVARADEEVSVYTDSIGKIDPRQKQLADLYQRLIELLTEKKIPLDQIMEMGTRRLRGVLALRHKEGFDLFERYEANDPAIASTREEIATLTEALDSERRPRPEDFKRASKEQRKAAESLEKQIKSGDALIATLKVKAGKLDAQIDGVEETLGDNEGRATDFLFPAVEEAVSEPKLPAQPGFFANLFSKKAAEPTVQAEEGLTGEVDVEQVLSEPVVTKAATPAKADVAEDVEGALPEPVVETAKPKWKFWA